MPNIIFKGITRANDSIFDEVNDTYDFLLLFDFCKEKYDE